MTARMEAFVGKKKSVPALAMQTHQRGEPPYTLPHMVSIPWGCYIVKGKNKSAAR